MNIKKIIAAVAAMSLLAGCGEKKTSEKNDSSDTAATAAETTEAASEETTEASEEQDYVELSKKLAKDLSEGKIDTTTALFSDATRQQLSDDMMKQVLEQMKEQMGAFKELKETTQQAQMGMTVTVTRMVYEKSEVDLTLAFNKEGKLDGILFQPAQDEVIEPQETDAYAETSIKVGEHELDGMLTMPKNAEKPPVVILIQGSGQHNMNEGSGETATFNELAHGLAERGIATIRYNKRFFQLPELAGDNNYSVEAEILEDADAAVKLAKGYVDEGKASSIFVMGHSLGGCVAPSIAQRNSDVKGIISLAGTSRDLIEVIIDQLSAQLEDAESDAQKNMIQAELDKAAKMQEGSDKDAILLDWGSNYYDSLKALKIGETAKSLDIPMLFLQGKEDVQVYADKDFPLWQETLKDKSNCTYKLYDGLGHFFSDEDGHFNKTVLDDTAEFIKNSEE